jgi:osmotically-inducible protein OsmY
VLDHCNPRWEVMTMGNSPQSSRPEKGDTMTRFAEAQPRVDSTDADLAKDVQDSLNASRNGLRRIDVWAEAGVIRLCGPVGSFFLRQTAITITKRVDGVRRVVDELTVDQNPTDTHPRSET